MCALHLFSIQIPHERFSVFKDISRLYEYRNSLEKPITDMLRMLQDVSIDPRSEYDDHGFHRGFAYENGILTSAMKSNLMVARDEYSSEPHLLSCERLSIISGLGVSAFDRALEMQRIGGVAEMALIAATIARVQLTPFLCM